MQILTEKIFISPTSTLFKLRMWLNLTTWKLQQTLVNFDKLQLKPKAIKLIVLLFTEKKIVCFGIFFLSRSAKSGLNVPTPGSHLRVQLMKQRVFSPPRNFLNVLSHRKTTNHHVRLVTSDDFPEFSTAVATQKSVKGCFRMFSSRENIHAKHLNATM
jgi:hypothetical protein